MDSITDDAIVRGRLKILKKLALLPGGTAWGQQMSEEDLEVLGVVYRDTLFSYLSELQRRLPNTRELEAAFSGLNLQLSKEDVSARRSALLDKWSDGLAAHEFEQYRKLVPAEYAGLLILATIWDRSIEGILP